MPKLARFSTPARLPDPHADAWSDRVKGLLAPYLDGSLPQFYDPTKKNTPAGAAQPMVSWIAFPATLRAAIPSQRERWKLADRRRHVQDEYCEWAVRRNAARKITRVTFTTELPEYWEHLFETAPERLLRLYRKLVDPGVELSHLRNRDGSYKRENRWNTGGRLAHLIGGPNNLAAAVDLVAKATVLRVDDDGRPVTNQQELVRCARLGEPLRNSDPQIASAVNVAAGQGAEITFADPPGLHLGRPLTAGMVTPDGADAARFWKIERGDAEHTLRARFEVPPTRGYVVEDIKIGGRPIKFGGQVADRVQVWVKVVVKPGNHTPKPEPCRA
jgi:hypothetical protein